MPLDPFFTGKSKLPPSPRITADQAAERLRIALGSMSLREWYTTVYLGSDHWAQLRARKLKKDPICEECRRYDATQVHHIRYRSIFDVLLTDLESMCGRCHGARHGRGRPRERFSPEQTAKAFDRISRKKYQSQRKPKRFMSAKEYAEFSQAKLNRGP